MSKRAFSGDPLDGTVQHITEAPAWQGDGETVDATEPGPDGDETTENVPLSDDTKPDVDGQTSLEDWSRWSA